MIKKIVIAGGCFWGVEAFFSKMDGVLDVVSGYANSNIKNPCYLEVKKHLTTAVEAVEIKYDATIVSLELIFSYLFKIIDLTAVDHQGEDYGHQYRTGIYYTSEEEKVLAETMIQALQKNLEEKVTVEVLPLENFYLAEDYHQDYLEKNPDGYCHINFTHLEERHKKIDKEALYKEVLIEVEALLEPSLYEVSILANVSALLKERFPYYSWVGFYLSNGKYLYLGPFQGRVACEKINFNKGVCGTAFSKQETLIVEDVHTFEGHIACDSGSNSEIVVPLLNKEDKIIGVLDVDSYRFAAFDKMDQHYLETLIQKLKNYLK